MSKSILLSNIRTLAGFTSKDTLSLQHNVNLLIRNGLIHSIFPSSHSQALSSQNSSPSDVEESKEAGSTKVSHTSIGKGESIQYDVEIDLRDEGLVTPSFVDPHTHIFPPRDRANEFAMRVTKTYQEIAAAGGGILSSVTSCREASEDQIYERNREVMESFIRQGTLTVEVKSGYGLDTESELKLLRVIQRLKTDMKDRIEVVPTFLGAHAFPAEYKGSEAKRDEYVELIIKEMLPQAAPLAEYCDVFCENGYFSHQQAERILTAAQSHGLSVRMHADEFEDSHAAELAGKLKAHSADHLMAVSDIGIDALAANKVVATILPGTTVFLGKQSFAPARKMIERGCRVAIASDHNPGSSVFNSQPMMMCFSMAYAKLSLEEAFMAATRNAALALNRPTQGLIEIGAQADLLVWGKRVQDLAQIPYYNHESATHIKYRVKRGNLF